MNTEEKKKKIKKIRRDRRLLDVAEDNAVADATHFFGGHCVLEVLVGVWMELEERAVGKLLLPDHHTVLQELKCASLSHRDGEDGGARHDVFRARASNALLLVAVGWGEVLLARVEDHQSVVRLLAELGT